jgi:folate-dependent phosphoribosylglycinamide formyltransferase PurN
MNVFLGPYFEVMEAAIDVVGVDQVIVEDRPTSAETINLAERYGIRASILAKDEPLTAVWPDHAELALVAGFGRLLRQSVLTRLKHAINFHPAIVEQNRGRHGLLTAALHGHEMMGITCHVIDTEEIDAGPIIAQYRVPIDYSANFDANHDRLRKAFEPMARLVLSDYKGSGKFTALPWTATEESYYPPLSPDQVRKVLDSPTLGSLYPGMRRER